VLNIAMMIETQALDLYLGYSNRTKDEKDQKKVSRLLVRQNGPDEIVATEILPGDIAHIHTDIPG